MSDRHLTVAELADRLRCTTSCLAHWRVVGKGPRFIKLGKVLYPLLEIEKWEQSRLTSSTAGNR